MSIKLTAFDIDGTLLSSNRTVSPKNLQTLKALGNKNIIRVAATGRNLYSLRSLFSDDFPIDYAVFSSGAGIIDWKTKTIIHSVHLNSQDIGHIFNLLMNKPLDFLVKSSIPNSHHMFYRINEVNNNDLMNYIDHYKDFAQPISKNFNLALATQFIVNINSDKELYNQFKNDLPGYKVILTTSPIDQKTLWLELFHKDVSKAKGIKHLCDKYEVQNEEVICIGNDYNDLDMLNYYTQSYVVANAPEQLTNRFALVSSNDNDGFTEAIMRAIDFK